MLCPELGRGYAKARVHHASYWSGVGLGVGGEHTSFCFRQQQRGNDQNAVGDHGEDADRLPQWQRGAEHADEEWIERRYPPSGKPCPDPRMRVGKFSVRKAPMPEKMPEAKKPSGKPKISIIVSLTGSCV